LEEDISQIDYNKREIFKYGFFRDFVEEIEKEKQGEDQIYIIKNNDSTDESSSDNNQTPKFN